MSIKVNTEIKRPSKEVIESFRSLFKEGNSVTPAVSDALNRSNAMSSDIKPLFEGIRVVGVALTVKTIASDIAPVIKALDLIQPGDMLVVDTHNSRDTAFWGEMVSLQAQRKGAAGIILDCSTRDVIEVRNLKFPVLCRGVTPNVAVLSGYGAINVPVRCGGVVVNPGDIVVVDDNGVVVVPLDEAEEVLETSRRYLGNELKVAQQIVEGVSLSEILGLKKLEQGAIDIMAQYEEQAKGEA